MPAVRMYQRLDYTRTEASGHWASFSFLIWYEKPLTLYQSRMSCRNSDVGTSWPRPASMTLS